MDFLEKWKLGQILSEDEVLCVLAELFKYAQKTFVFDTKTKIDTKLYDLFEKLDLESDSKSIIRFSQSKCVTPFISLTFFEDTKPTHVIKSLEYSVYVYEN